MNFTFNSYYTLIVAVIVLLIGKFLVNKIDFLKRYNIPEPVAGGSCCSTMYNDYTLLFWL